MGIYFYSITFPYFGLTFRRAKSLKVLFAATSFDENWSL
jgi:hypothetical protein